MQLHRLEPYLHTVTVGAGRNLPVGWKQRQLTVSLRVFVKRFNQLAPGILLAVVDLAEIQHLTLHHLATSTPPVLDDVPVTMLLPVFEASIEP